MKKTFSHHFIFSITLLFYVFILTTAMHDAVNEAQGKDDDGSDPSDDVIVVPAGEIEEDCGGEAG